MVLFENKPQRNAYLLGAGIALAILCFFIVSKYHPFPGLRHSPWNDHVRKSDLAAMIHKDLMTSVEMEKSAVIALTDEESRVFAEKTRMASKAVDTRFRQLESLVFEGKSTEKLKLMDEFSKSWAELRNVDELILDLAVKNTNLKAARLSMVEGSDALEHFEKALERIVGRCHRGSSKECGIFQPVFTALTSCHAIDRLLVIHNAESDTAAMDRLEKTIKTKEEAVSGALRVLSSQVKGENRKDIALAESAFSDFIGIAERVIALSRTNSNIKSLELSLGKKRILAAQCSEILSSFENHLRWKSGMATK